MILTTKGRYAVMAMLEMVKRQDNAAINLSNIATNQDIPHSYLEQLFLKLKRDGIVTSIRGPGGGYKLNNTPDKISIYRIIKAVEDDIKVPKCGHNTQCSTHIKCGTHYLWKGLEKNVVNYLSSISLSDLIMGNCSSFTAPAPVKNNANDITKIYLDYNATTPIHLEVLEEMNSIFGPSNPSSLHWHGRKAKALVENARSKIAKALGVKLGTDEHQITFTSSGTEANNLILYNFADKDLLISSVEHPSILESSKLYGNRILINIDQDGQIDMNHFKACLAQARPGSLVSIIMANNETGVIQQNMHEIINLAHLNGLFVHSDYVQAFGKIPMDLGDLDFATISSHKIGGPLGAAALVHKTKIPIMPQIMGGGQERGMRSGTENVAAIVGFGKAAELIKIGSSTLRDKMETMIKDICPNAIFYGQDTVRLPNTSMVLMPGVDAQQQLIQFDLSDISVSAGSACSSGKMKISHVLMAMGIEKDAAKCAIRISLGTNTQEDEIRKFVYNWERIWERV